MCYHVWFLDTLLVEVFIAYKIVFYISGVNNSRLEGKNYFYVGDE